MTDTSSKAPEMIVDCSCHIGENPCWNPFDECVYWCDIPSGRIFRYDPAKGISKKCHEGGVVGGFTLQDDGSILLFMAGGAIKRWQNGDLLPVVESIPEEIDSRFNDVIADPAGRVLCGTMSTPKSAGRLYLLNRNRALTVVLEGIGCSNGMAFSPDRKQLYYTDSFARTIYQFDYDVHRGTLSNQRVFVKTDHIDGVPDGATMDADGCVWSAQWGGSCIVCYARDGSELRRIMFPVKKVSSLIFGGNDYTDLYVTSAGGDNKSQDGQQAGSLFRLRGIGRGVPDFFSRITLG